MRPSQNKEEKKEKEDEEEEEEEKEAKKKWGEERRRKARVSLGCIMRLYPRMRGAERLSLLALWKEFWGTQSHLENNFPHSVI